MAWNLDMQVVGQALYGFFCDSILRSSLPLDLSSLLKKGTAHPILSKCGPRAGHLNQHRPGARLAVQIPRLFPLIFGFRRPAVGSRNVSSNRLSSEPKGHPTVRNAALEGPRGNYACTTWVSAGVPLYLAALLTPGGELCSAFCPGLSHSFNQQMFLMSGSGPDLPFPRQ